MSSTKIGNEVLRLLTNSHTLSILNVSYCKGITNEGIRSISGMSSLLKLFLSGCKITQDFFKYIEKLNLIYLEIKGCEISNEVVNSFSSNNPSIEIIDA